MQFFASLFMLNAPHGIQGFKKRTAVSRSDSEVVKGDKTWSYVLMCYSIVMLQLKVASVVLGSFSSVSIQDNGWEECLRNDLFCVQWDVKPYSLTHSFMLHAIKKSF